jgi:hypothetical protein
VASHVPFGVLTVRHELAVPLIQLLQHAHRLFNIDGDR